MTDLKIPKNILWFETTLINPNQTSVNMTDEDEEHGKTLLSLINHKKNNLVRETKGKNNTPTMSESALQWFQGHMEEKRLSRLILILRFLQARETGSVSAV